MKQVCKWRASLRNNGTKDINDSDNYVWVAHLDIRNIHADFIGRVPAAGASTGSPISNSKAVSMLPRRRDSADFPGDAA
eukprot:6199583-Pleurochrysis_carterae.AAC.2